MIDGRVSIEDLRVFLAVAEAEHVTAAAAALHLSQPAVTRTVSRLERQFGVALFDRPGQRVRLNAFGHLLIDHAQQIVADFDVARSDFAKLLDPDAGPVRLGFLASLGTWLVPEIIDSFRQVVPAAEFVLRQAHFDPIAEMLRAGQIDLLLTSPRPHLPSPVGWKHLGDEHLELAVPPGHRLANRRHVRLEEAANERFVVLDHTTEFRSLSDRLCRHAGFSPTIALETDQVATARALVGTGLGVAVLPILHRPYTATPPTIPIADPGASRPYGLAWITRRHLPSTAEVLRTWLVNLTPGNTATDYAKRS